MTFSNYEIKKASFQIYSINRSRFEDNKFKYLNN